MSLLQFSLLIRQPYTSVRRALYALHLYPARIGGVIMLDANDMLCICEYLDKKAALKARKYA